MIAAPPPAEPGAAGRLDRRTFLRAALATAGAVVVGGAGCARGPVLPSGFEGVHIPDGARLGLGVHLGGLEFVGGLSQRVPLGFTDAKGLPVEGLSGRAWISDTEASEGPFAVTWEAWEHPEEGARGFYITEMPIPKTSLATLLVVTDELYGSTVFRPYEFPGVPGPGEAAISVPTPTFERPRGIANVCTRTPACPMHDVSLDHALASGRPVVFTISSPLLCTSRTCGPIVEEILEARARRGDDAVFIHAEVYAGDTATELSPTSKAWGIESDPWTWVIARDGRVSSRFEGPLLWGDLDEALDDAV